MLQKADIEAEAASFVNAREAMPIRASTMEI